MVRGETYKREKACEKCGTHLRYRSNGNCYHCHRARGRAYGEAQKRQAHERKAQTMKDKPVNFGMRKFTKRLRALWPDFNIPEDTLANRFLTMRLVASR